jgi:hypothetical protein
MTVGEKIKSTLNLTQFPNVYITKGLRSGSKSIYYIFFNSAYPQVKINHTKLKRMQNVDILRGEHLERGEVRPIEYFPFQKLEDFNSSVKNAYIVLYDIAGMNKFLRYDYFSESTHYSSSDFYTDLIKGFSDVQLKVYQNRLNELTIPQLKQIDSLTSDLTKKYKDIRDKVQGRANTNTKFLKTEVIEETGSIRFYFLTEATSELEKQGKVGHKLTPEPKKQFNPTTNKLESNPSQTYTLIMQLENIIPNNAYSGEPWIYVYDGEIINSKLILDLIEVADVKLFSNDPSFTYQGFSYKLTNLNANIYPNTIPDRQWRAKHGDAILTKHWNSVLSSDYINFVSNQLAVSLFSQLKKLGYVDSKTKKLTAHI